MCRPAAVSRYRQRVSGPLLDRFDLVVKVDRLEATDVSGLPPETSLTVRRKVRDASTRLAENPPRMSPAADDMLRAALDSDVLTARGVQRVGGVATTIAALASGDQVGADHVAEALGLRVDW